MSGIMVNEVNEPPVWPRLPDVRVPANATFSFAVAASDPDLPAQTPPLAAQTTFVLGIIEPLAASIRPQLGQLRLSFPGSIVNA